MSKINSHPSSHLSHSAQDFDMMTLNLLEIKREITERDQPFQQSMMKSSKMLSSEGDFLETFKLDRSSCFTQIKQQYLEYLSEKAFPKNHEEKLNILLCEPISTGSTVALFEMVCYFRQAINIDILSQISQKAFQQLINTNSQEYHKIRCLAELIAECGVFDRDMCEYFHDSILHQTHHFQLGFLILTNIGFIGLNYLIDIATRDIPNLSCKVLDWLSRTQIIIKSVLIPTLLEELQLNRMTRHKDLTLAVLNRLGQMNENNATMQFLLGLMADATIDKRILLATIRCGGLAGQQILLDLLKMKNLSESLHVYLLSVISWRVNPKNILRIRSIEFSLDGCLLPGSLYQYEGKIEPTGNFQHQISCENDSLCLNSRDFLGILEQFVRNKSAQFSESDEIRQEQSNNQGMFYLRQILHPTNENEPEILPISGDIISALSGQLSNRNVKIREAALLELGNIGLPEAEPAVNKVTKCLWDSDSNIRSAACWAISKVCATPTKNCLQRLTELLKDHFWKVRTSACIALGVISKEPTKLMIEALLKALNDGTINKLTVCECLVKLGEFGESILLELLRTCGKNDFKLRESVISSLEHLQIHSPFMHAFIEQISRHSRDSRFETRQLCLNVLTHIRQNTQAEKDCQLTYFKTKNILPFYYSFLDDSSSKIRELAANNIISFGNYAEMIFIEGMTKGEPLAKIQCVRNLAKLGIQNFRALILGLRDEDEKVRKITSEVITVHFKADEIVRYFKEKENHSISLLCNLKDILGNSDLKKELRVLLKEVIFNLEKLKE